MNRLAMKVRINSIRRKQMAAMLKHTLVSTKGSLTWGQGNQHRAVGMRLYQCHML
jgi:hypothetical protein